MLAKAQVRFPGARFEPAGMTDLIAFGYEVDWFIILADGSYDLGNGTKGTI